MANHVSHAALPFPIKGCRFTVPLDYLDADGDPTDPTTPDTERSIDGAAYADCTEEATTISGSNGGAYITLTGDELNSSMTKIAAKVSSGPKATVGTLLPRVLPVLFSGTASAGANDSITLATDVPAIANLLIGCIVKTTGGTGGGGGSGSQGNQGRVITAFSTGRVATVVPNWETNPSSDTTYEILLTEMSILRYADVLRWNGANLATPDTAGYPVATIKDGTGTGELDTSSGKVLLQDNAVTAAAIADNAIDAGAIASGAITSAKFAAGAITAAVIAADAIDDDALATDAVTAIQSGLSTLTAATVRSAVGLASANLDTQLADLPTVAEFEARTLVAASYATASALDVVDNLVDTEVSAIKGVTDKLDTTLELDGAVYRFTTNALEQGPAGAGGDSVWTEEEKDEVLGTLASISSAEVTFTSPVLTSDTASIEKGDGYYTADGRSLSWTLSGHPSLSGATVVFIGLGLTKAVSVSGSTVTLELTEAQTAAMPPGVHPFEIQATLSNSHVATLLRGRMTVRETL